MADIIFFHNDKEFENWLLKNHSTKNELWVGYHKKKTEISAFTWSLSVDVALCFGWIDGIRKSIDDYSYKIRFSPRKQNSVWSAVNVKKVEKLIQLGRMKPEGLKLYNSRKDLRGYSSQKRKIKLKKEYEVKIKDNIKAWDFFSNLAPSYKRDSIWWIMSAKKEETQFSRLQTLILCSQEGVKIPILQRVKTK